MPLERMRETRRRRKQGTVSSCAACKLLRRRCTQDCTFAPYFPASEPQKFADVHKVFGASNVNKMLQDMPVHQRSDAVNSMVYEANARVKDPVYGCVGTISSLHHQIDVLQTQLALARAQVIHMHMCETVSPNSIESYSLPSKLMTPHTGTMLSPNIVVDNANLGESLWSC